MALSEEENEGGGHPAHRVLYYPLGAAPDTVTAAGDFLHAEEQIPPWDPRVTDPEVQHGSSSGVVQRARIERMYPPTRSIFGGFPFESEYGTQVALLFLDEYMGEDV